MRLWRRRERRQANATDLAVTAAHRLAAGEAPDPAALAAAQTAAGLWRRAFQGAELSGDAMAVERLRPLLGWLAGRLCVRGEAFLRLEPTGEVRPCELTELTGSHADPVYRLQPIEPDGAAAEVSSSAEATLAIIAHPSDRQPRRGRSPLQAAAQTAATAAEFEKKIAKIAGRSPLNAVTLDTGLSGDQAAQLRAGLDPDPELYGSQPLVLGVSGARIGTIETDAQLPPVSRDLRRSLGDDLLLLLGVPPAMVGEGEGAAVREAMRQFHAHTIRPAAAVISDEIMRKTGMRLAFAFPLLRVVDHAQNARAFSAYVKGGLTAEEAAAILGLELGDWRNTETGGER